MPPFIAADLEQVYRRVAFSVAVGNRDDHLRNNGFILTPSAWRLAPAFDLNPNIDKAKHVLNRDESDDRPSLATGIEAAEWYGASKDRGAPVVDEVLQQTRPWRTAAAKLGIAKADIDLIGSAFNATDGYQKSNPRPWAGVTDSMLCLAPIVADSPRTT
jgi:serine/threonine-protein kinase HipA